MSYLIRDFKIQDLEQFDMHPSAKWAMLGKSFEEYVEDYKGLESISFTIEYKGKPIFLGGMVPKWANSVLAWTIMGSTAGIHMLYITKAVKAYIAQTKAKRIECMVLADFPQGKKWMRLLGFTKEATMRNFTPKGETILLYSIVRS